MAKIIAFVVLVCVIVGMASCDDCDYKGLTIKQGQDGYPKGECIRVHCISKNDVSAVPCPQIGIPQGCNVTYEGQDNSKPYPDCCPKAYCKE